MAHNRDNRASQARRALDHLAADGKKTAFAVALLTVMAFMWFRVLTGRKPAAAAANSSAGQQSQKLQTPPKNICYLTLPNVPGRNDYMNRDFFAARDWECFRQGSVSRRGSVTQAQAVAVSHAQEIAARAVQKLKLEAVLTQGNPQAYINDQLLGLGDRFVVREGEDTCEFEVVRIYEDSVLIGCNGTQLTLRLRQHLDVNK